MKYMLVIILTIAPPDEAKRPKTMELRIPQDNREECMKASKTFRFSLPVFSMETRCEPRRDNEQPTLKAV